MAFYELMFSIHKHENWTTFSVGGMHVLVRTAQYLDSLAKIGKIPGVIEVKIYDDTRHQYVHWYAQRMNWAKN